MEKVGAYTDRVTEDGEWRSGNPATGQQATPMLAAYFNMLQRELAGVIEAAGLTLDAANDAQLVAAIRRLRGGAGNTGIWAWSPSVAGNPGAGRVSLNHAAPASATQIIIMEASAESLDYSGTLGLLRAGDTISLQLRDATTFAHRYKVTGEAVDNGAWRAVPVSYVGGAGAVPADASTLFVAFTQANLAEQSTDGIGGSFANLRASATGLSTLVTVAAEAVCVKSSSGQQKVLNNLALSINLAGAGANGLDTGVSAASTWYSVWVIWNGSTVAGLFSLSANDPVMPGGYTHKARVGWIRSNSSDKNPRAFTQAGNTVAYSTADYPLPLMASGVQGNPVGNSPKYVAVPVAGFVPPTASKIKLSLSGYAASAIAAPNIAYSGITDTSVSSAPFLITPNSSSPTQITVTGDMIIESANIFYASNAAICGLSCCGWEDNL